MKNLYEMTIVELTALYNSKVGPEEQIKKFRTKDQAIARVQSVAGDCLDSKSEAVDPAIDPQTKGYIIVNDAPLTILDALMLAPKGTTINGDPVEKAVEMEAARLTNRRKPVKGVVKLCRDLLARNQNTDTEIIAAIAFKYYSEGGYDEKAARSSAQTILADTKKRLAVPVTA